MMTGVKNSQKPAYDGDIRSRAKQIVSRMTLRQKIGQMNQEAYNGENFEVIAEEIRRGELGSVILATSPTAGNDKQHRTSVAVMNEFQKIAEKESPNGIPLIIGRDVIHGHRTALPIPLALAASFDPSLVRRAYECIAHEAACDGINWTFSPMIDISRDPRWGRCAEGSGEDPFLASQMAAAVVRGFQEGKYPIAACAKHYIGYGAAEGGRDYCNAEIGDHTLKNVYLPSFRAAVDAGVATVMTDFSMIGGVPVTCNKYLITDLLKGELGFDGFTVSDWASIKDLVYFGVSEDDSDAAQRAADAGLDMDMVSRVYIENLEKLVSEGKIDESVIDEACERIIGVKIAFGIMDNPYTEENMTYSVSEHRDMAKKCAEESVVLLKNNGILPLSADKRVILTGTMLGERSTHCGTWSLDADIDAVTTFAEAMQGRTECVGYPQSTYMWDDCLGEGGITRFDAAVVFLGESQRMTGERNSLASVEIPPEQAEYVRRLAKSGTPLIGVMSFGRPIALGDIERYFDAIVYTWHAGTCAAEATADILFGKVNPSGRLPMTLPRATGQIPLYYNCPNERDGAFYYNKNMHKYHDVQSTPQYPFGYGLSYTEFEYSDISADKTSLTLGEIEAGGIITVSAAVKNVGKYAGTETVQCYIRDMFAYPARPVKELCGFERVMIEPGETKTVVFEIGFESLAYCNADKKRVVEPGTFKVFIGADSLCENSIEIEIK